MESIEWEVGTLIRLVAGRNITAICRVAKELAKGSDPFDEVSNRTLYEKYCDCCAKVKT